MVASTAKFYEIQKLHAVKLFLKLELEKRHLYYPVKVSILNSEGEIFGSSLAVQSVILKKLRPILLQNNHIF